MKLETFNWPDCLGLSSLLPPSPATLVPVEGDGAVEPRQVLLPRLPRPRHRRSLPRRAGGAAHLDGRRLKDHPDWLGDLEVLVVDQVLGEGGVQKLEMGEGEDKVNNKL